jgi:poly-gamma-glutamate synthesis protein (capsule biosynthesis protein)
VFNGTLPILQNADLTLINLEGAITSTAEKNIKTYNFKFAPSLLPYLKQAGIDYVSITNNHSFDYGEKGFLDTLQHIQKSGLATSGGGKNIDECFIPSVFDFTSQGASFEIFSIGAYPREQNGFDGAKTSAASANKAGILWATDTSIERLGRAINKGKISVVMIHGGQEWHDRPDDQQKSLYRKLIDLGFDIVIGSHPHILQGYEYYKNGLIFYSLGNFIFPGMDEMPHAEDSIIARIGFSKDRIVAIETIPVKLNSSGVDIHPEKAKIRTRLAALSEGL